MELGPKQKQWLEDLPKFKKTKGVLCCGDAFCCLGVYLHTQNDKPWVSTGGGKYGVRVGGLLQDAALPRGEWIALGLRSEVGDFSSPIKAGRGYYKCLADLNDNGPFRTHAQVAKFIREHKDKIFTRSA